MTDSSAKPSNSRNGSRSASSTVALVPNRDQPRRQSEASATLVLAAHGAADDPRCAAPVERHAEVIRGLERYESVVTIYWKQHPQFRDLYEVTGSRTLIVVPIMTASGYYTRSVLPRELRLDAPPPDREVRVTLPIGELDAMADLIAEQAIHAASHAAIDPADARILLIGHGTRRDPERSGATTYRHARTLEERGGFRAVHVGFLEQDPTVPDAFAQIPGIDPIIIVPYLIASGGHGADDIPTKLGAAPGTQATVIGDRSVVLAKAAGEHPRTVELILEAARSGDGSVEQPATQRSATSW